MALNKLKKWIGTQAMTAFFDQLNDNVDATNAEIDLVETNSATVAAHMAESASDDVHGLAWSAPVNISLQNGWTGTAIVYKNGLNQVRLVFNFSGGTSIKNTQIGILPAGYRPQYSVCYPIINTNNARANSLLMRASGAVIIPTNEDFTDANYQGDVIYYAEN